MPRVNIPNLGTVNFPDSMSSADIEHEAGKLYLSYAGNLPGVQRPENPINQELQKRQTAGLAGVPGGAPQVAPATPAYEAAVGLPLAGAAAVMGGAVAAPVVMGAGRYVAGQAAQQMAKYPTASSVVKQYLAMKAIEESRNIPVVGKYIPPGAEMLALFLGRGGGGAATAEGAAVRGAAAEAEGAAARELTPIQKAWVERGGVLKSQRPEGPITGTGPQARPQPTPSPTTPPPAPSAAAPEPSFPPPQGRTAFQQPSRYQMQQEEAGLQQQMRADLESHGRNAALEEGRIRRAASTVDVPKSTLIERARAGTVTYTNAPPPVTKSPAVMPKTREQMMDLMKQSIKDVRARKGRIQ